MPRSARPQAVGLGDLLHGNKTVMDRCFLCGEIESPLGMDDAITIDHSTVITV